MSVPSQILAVYMINLPYIRMLEETHFFCLLPESDEGKNQPMTYSYIYLLFEPVYFRFLPTFKIQ